MVLLMEEILHHSEPLNYCNSQDSRDLRWCRISSINSMDFGLQVFGLEARVGMNY